MFYLMFCPQWTTPPLESAFSIPTFTYNVCPLSDNAIRDEIQDRMCGSGTADGSFATETASSLVRKLNVYTPSETSAAHSVPLDGVENFVGPVAAPARKQYGGGKYRRRVSRLFDR
jgi:hypothetical protein